MSRFQRILTLCCGLLVTCAWTTAEAIEIARIGAPGVVALEWNGVPAQAIRSAKGGSIQGVVEERQDGSSVDKRISGVRYENLELQVGAGLERKFYEWINASWMGKPDPASGAVLVCSSMGGCSRKSFTAAILSEVTVPTLDGASKERCYLGVSLQPGLVKVPMSVNAPPPKIEQSVWLTSNFRLAIDGLDCTGVRKVESFTVKQGVKGASAEFPDLEISLGSKGYETWRQWFEGFVVKATDNVERNGEITFYATDLQTVLGKIRLIHLGITSLDLVPGASATASSTAVPGAESIATLKAKLYCERMELSWGATAMSLK
jgi:hypothetical protein